MWKILGPIRTTDQAQEEDLHPGEGEGEEDSRNSQTTIQEIRTSTASITEEDITPKVPTNQEEYCQDSAREGNDEHHLLNAEPTSPELLETTLHEFSIKSSCNATISATTTILATFSAVLPSVAGYSVNPTTAANPRNIATTTRIKFKTIIGS
jgi:hypothetical protein